MRGQRGSGACSKHGIEAFSERDGIEHSARDSDAQSERDADVRSWSAGDLCSEQRSIVIDRGQGTHGGEAAVVDDLAASGGVATPALGRGQGDVTVSGGGRGGSNGRRGCVCGGRGGSNSGRGGAGGGNGRGCGQLSAGRGQSIVHTGNVRARKAKKN